MRNPFFQIPDAAYRCVLIDFVVAHPYNAFSFAFALLAEGSAAYLRVDFCSRGVEVFCLLSCLTQFRVTWHSWKMTFSLLSATYTLLRTDLCIHNS
jgi:hypothetical protein